MNKPSNRILEEARDGGTPVNRHPGDSYQKIVAADRNPAPPVLDEHYTFLGNRDISPDRYGSKVFFDHEMDHMWRRVWQWACREEHIPEAGDYYVYNIGKYSVLVVRGENGDIKAFYNFCQHRGTKLRLGEGVGHAKEFRCPFHGWTYALDGSLKPIPCAWDFAHVDPATFHLDEVRVGLWGGFVFINMDPNAPSLEEYLSPLPEHFRNWDLSKRYIALHVVKEMPCNWKTTTEAFLEQYHLRETHPQLLDVIADTVTQYDIFGTHVSRFVAAMAVPSPEIVNQLPPKEIIKRMVVSDTSVSRDEAEVKAGDTARSVMAAYLRRTLAEKYKKDLSGLSDAEIMDPIQYYLFPNFLVFTGLSIPILHRIRPNGTNPDRSIFELLQLRPLPDNVGVPVPPPDPIHLGENDLFTSLKELDHHSARTFDQDADNLRAQRDGAKFMTKGMTLSTYQEIRVRHLNQTLDLYLATPTNTRVPISGGELK